MEITKLNDKKLMNDLKDFASTERSLGLTILKYLCEVARRKCYADLGYSSLFIYCVQELKYSESDAYKRIESAKLLKEFPTLEEKIVSGKITTTNLSLVASSLKKNRVTNPKHKIEVISSIENKTKVEVQKSLINFFGEDVPKKETVKIVNQNEVRLSLNISEELMKKLDKLKSIKNRAKVLTTCELLEALVDQELAAEEKRLEKSNAPLLFPEKGSARYIPTTIKKQVWKRANGSCEICKSNKFLQYDHIQPFALGGNSSIDNIQLLCRTHNLRRGIKTFGLTALRR